MKKRSRKIYKRRNGRSKSHKPWITRPGKLGGPGFLKGSKTRQLRSLRNCVKKYGYRSCLGSIMVLERSQKIRQKYGLRLFHLRSWMKRKYGRK